MVQGDSINFLTMVSDKFLANNGKSYKAKFRCKCGNIKEIAIYDVISGHTKSCGCIQRNYAKMRSYTHGDTYTRLYGIWSDMKSRCHNSNQTDYARYGGRGISVCRDWNCYENFRDWAINNGYSDNLTIDRIDVNKGYSPDNCRWATAKQQSRNKRNNIRITYKGETKVLVEWCEQLNLPYGTIEMRIHRGWNGVDALTKPIKNKGGKHI